MNKDTVLSDEKLQLITGQIFVGQGILIAHQLGVFKLISQKAQTTQNIAKKLNLSIRAVQALISCASVFNLIEYTNTGYRLNKLGKVYLDENNDEYYGDVLDLLIQENEIMNYSSIKNTILTNRSQINNGKGLFTNNDNVGITENFVKAIHQKAFNPAFFWPSQINLKKHKKFIDIGGGSGIHTISACIQNTHLKGIVCDKKEVIYYTKKYIKKFNLKSRIHVAMLDIWQDDFPKGDIYFLGDIFHDWDTEKCIYLAKKCFQHLPSNGKIILHEMLFNNKKTGPFLSAAYNMKMLAWTEGQQFSKIEIKNIIKKAGFKKIKIIKGLGNWSLIIGIKD